MANPNNPGDGKNSLDKGVDQGKSRFVPRSTLVESHFSQELQKSLINHTKVAGRRTNPTRNPGKLK